MARGAHQAFRMKRLLLACLVVSAAASGCAPTQMKSVMVHRPEDKLADSAVSEMWASEIRTVARDGDWFLSRSYYAVGDVIALTTRGEDLSHASIYDAKRDMVVESVGEGARGFTRHVFEAQPLRDRRPPVEYVGRGSSTRPRARQDEDRVAVRHARNVRLR